MEFRKEGGREGRREGGRANVTNHYEFMVIINSFSFIFHCSLPPTSLLHAASYDRMAECFGGRGHKIRRPQELRQIMKLIKDGNVYLPVLINVLISVYRICCYA